MRPACEALQGTLLLPLPEEALGKQLCWSDSSAALLLVQVFVLLVCILPLYISYQQERSAKVAFLAGIGVRQQHSEGDCCSLPANTLLFLWAACVAGWGAVYVGFALAVRWR